MKGDVKEMKGDIHEMKGDIHEIKEDIGDIKHILLKTNEKLDSLVVSMKELCQLKKEKKISSDKAHS